MATVLRKAITASLPIPVLIKGFILLNLLLLPLTFLMTVFIGIMAGGSPGADPLQAFALIIAMIYLAPAGVFLGHLVVAKIIDTVFFIVPPLKMSSSWIGLFAGSLLFVILGNIFVDDLYQWRQGDPTLSILALGADLLGLAAVAGTGMIPIRWIDERIQPPRHGGQS
jgi:hypothetical protein